MNWIRHFVPHYTNPSILPAYQTYHIPAKLQTLIISINNTLNTDNTLLQQSITINDIENHYTYTLNQRQHAIATQVIISLLAQSDFMTQNFNKCLQTLNNKMSALTFENLNAQYKRYTKLRTQFLDHIRPTLPMRHTQPNNRRRIPIEYTHPRPRQNIGEHTQHPTPNQTRPTQRVRFQTHQNTPRVAQLRHPHNQLEQTTPPVPILTNHHNPTVDIDWDDATITTETKTPNPPHSISRHTTTKHTKDITDSQLPNWKIILYIILYKIVSKWDKASAETLYRREQTIRWPTFRPIRILKAVTPIMILMLVMYIPIIKADETIIRPTSETKTIPNSNNYMDDDNIQNKPFSGVKNHFIYDWQGNTVINPSVHYYTINYQACDLHTLKQHLQNIIRHLSKLCNYTPNTNTEQKHLIRTQDNHHILLNERMNIIQARQTCNSINSKLIEVRTNQEAHRLETFMTTHNINSTFSGIYYDPRIQEFLYTNGEYVTDKEKTTHNLPPPFSEFYNKLTTWKALLIAATYTKQTYKPIFLYSKAGAPHLVTLASIQHGGYSYYGKPHTSITTFPICATPRATKSRDIIFQKWKNQCQTIHKNLATQLQSTIKRIIQLKPAKLPQPTKHIKLFGDYNKVLKTQNPTKNQMKQQTQTTTTCNEQLSNTSQPMEKNKKPKIPLTKPIKHHRQKRTPTPLEFFPTATFIYNAIQFIAQIYNNYINSYPNPERNPNDKETQQYIYYLTKQNAYDEDLIQTNNFISITNTQTKLQIHITTILNYMNLILNKLDKLYNSNYNAQPTDFLTQNQYDAIRYTIHKNYDMTIPNYLRENKIFLNTNNESYIMTLAIPLQPEKHNTDLFRVTPMPIWKSNTRYTPNIPHKTFGIPRQGTQKFVTTTEEELTNCIANPYCETAKGTQKATQPPCGINEFFHNNKNCIYSKDTQQTNWYHQLENVIYFSIRPNTTTTMHLDCSGNPYYGIGTTNQMPLQNYGEITIPFNCQAQIEGNTYRPAIRTLFKHETTDKQHVHIKSLHPKLHFHLQQNSITTNLSQNNTNTSQTTHTTAIYATTVILLTIIIITLLIYLNYKNKTLTRQLHNQEQKEAQNVSYHINKKFLKARKQEQNEETYTNLSDNIHKHYGETQERDHIYTQIQTIRNPQSTRNHHTMETIKEEPTQKKHTYHEHNNPSGITTTERNNTTQTTNIYPLPYVQTNHEICPYCNAHFHNKQDKIYHIQSKHRRN